MSKLTGNLRQSREIVDEEVTEAQDRQHRNYDGSKGAQYEVGDFVLLHSPALTEGTVWKLYCSYEVSYQVMRQVGQNNYEIQKVGKERERETCS